MRILIRYNHAKAQYYIDLAQFLLSKSNMSKQARWDPLWSSIYGPNGPYVRNHLETSEHPKMQVMVLCRSNQNNWEYCRK